MNAEIEADDKEESTTTNLEDLDGFDTAEEPTPRERGWRHRFSAYQETRMDPWKTTVWETEDGRYIMTKCNTEVSTTPRGGTYHDVLQVGDDVEITEMYGVDDDNLGAHEVARQTIIADGGSVYEAVMRGSSGETEVEISTISDGWPEDDWEAVNEESELNFRFEFCLV